MIEEISRPTTQPRMQLPEGISINQNPGESPDAGIFNLPIGFDDKKWAAQWVEDSNVEFQQQRQPLIGTRYTADGWEIYRPDGEDSEPVRVKTGGKNGKTYVLMVRPKALQKQVNAIYGNVSKDRISRETKGETVAGGPLQDPGMLTEQRLQEVQGGGLASESGDVTPNRIHEAPEVIAT